MIVACVRGGRKMGLVRGTVRILALGNVISLTLKERRSEGGGRKGRFIWSQGRRGGAKSG